MSSVSVGSREVIYTKQYMRSLISPLSPASYLCGLRYKEGSRLNYFLFPHASESPPIKTFHATHHTQMSEAPRPGYPRAHAWVCPPSKLRRQEPQRPPIFLFLASHEGELMGLVMGWVTEKRQQPNTTQTQYSIYSMPVALAGDLPRSMDHSACLDG